MDNKILDTYARFIVNMHDARREIARTQKEAACLRREASTWRRADSQIHTTFQLGDRGILAPHAQEDRLSSESSSEYEARILRNVRQALPVVMSGTNLHERIANTLGWTVAECQAFSIASLRDLVRPVDPSLAQEISTVISGGTHIRKR